MFVAVQWYSLRKDIRDDVHSKYHTSKATAGNAVPHLVVAFD